MPCSYFCVVAPHRSAPSPLHATKKRGVMITGNLWFVRQYHWSFVFSTYSWGACLWGLKINIHLPSPWPMPLSPKKGSQLPQHVWNCVWVCVAWQLNLRRTWGGFPISQGIDVRPLKTTPLITARPALFPLMKSWTCLLPPFLFFFHFPPFFFHFHFIYVSCVFWLIGAWLWKFKHDEPEISASEKIWPLPPFNPTFWAHPPPFMVIK